MAEAAATTATAATAATVTDAMAAEAARERAVKWNEGDCRLALPLLKGGLPEVKGGRHAEADEGDQG